MQPTCRRVQVNFRGFYGNCVKKVTPKKTPGFRAEYFGTFRTAAFRELRGSNSEGWAAIDHSFRINGFEQLTQEYLDHSDDHQGADGTFTGLALR
jgi:hypothetical protein